ncbi:cytochrome c5 family protein [Psychrobacter okhotskensis]|uniref:c-type cytochrome n=1 Tax=Psychrobacter okhotskensis TaxID=212403 RepID=UPI001565AA14|nr:c-type cytochrome [Psychrobacter okhotskensis]NRD69741.1 cytochrome c5 family protein [Psychrobacter okhotskensis]
MSNKQPRMSFGKWTLSVFSISALLALSACSGDNTTAEEPAAVSESADAVAVEPAAPVAEPEVVTPEPAVESEISEAIEEPVAEAEPEVLAADAGAKLYEAQCKMCHAQGLLEAPKYGDTAAWSARITKDKETLYSHSAKGFNKMPAQAINGVTEAQVHAAVDYMLASVS